MSSEKTEKPTDKKIRDARDKGQIAVSRDLARLVMLVVVLEMAMGTETLWHTAVDSLMHMAFSSVGQPFSTTVVELGNAATRLVLTVFATFFVVCTTLACVANWGQFGVLFAPEALQPKFDKLNPVNGFMQIFSKKKLGELAITLFKAVVIGLIVFILIRDELPNIVQLAGGTPKESYLGFIKMVRGVFHSIAGVCLVLGLIDLAMQKYFLSKQLAMDMEEIKREYREMEGDPMLKGMRKQLGRQLAMSGPANDTKKANAVVVNPTHFAVAMLYDAETPVPFVVAKGKDEIAQAMIEAAKAAGIPVIRHVWLARTLYATGRPDAPVPKSSYEAVAYVYAVVNELRAMNQTDRVVELERYGDPS